ncbi:transposase, partial [Pontibacter sp. 13R65]|uniref:transposase n=1 Tax=Pontibacter sp. 13R65 TaxID=3127458 RepID=UPI00301C8BEE
MSRQVNNAGTGSDVFSLARFFSHRLSSFLAPFLLELDRLLDRRLINTFSGLCESILRHRTRPTSLLLTELGEVLLSPAKAPAGTKRISNLLRSPRWHAGVIADYLARQAQAYAQQLLEKQELVLLLWDESVQEKPESLQSAVRSSKAKRLLRIKRGYYEPPTREAVHVPGLRWVGLLLCGLKAQPLVASFRWWTSRGKQATSLAQVKLSLLQWARETFASAVLHVFDRGYASSQWLGLLLARRDRFLMRWPSAYKLLDVLGRVKRASLFSVGRKASSSQLVWGRNRKCQLRRSLLWMPGLHPHYLSQPLTLIICRPGQKGRQPWYLLTDEEVRSDKDAWRLVHAYARRWQIEQSFRFTKAELGMESCRLWFWENKMKLLQIVTLV